MSRTNYTCLIDADILVYEIGHSKTADGQDLTLQHAKARLTRRIQNIKEYVQQFYPPIEDWQLFITADDKSNFRFEVATIQEYKANRGPSNKPKLYTEIREVLQEQHGAKLISDMEADDEMSIRACQDPEHTIIVTKDKDLRGTLGWHVNMNLKYPPIYTEDPGFLFLVRGKSKDRGLPKGKKMLYGHGLKWFYAQCLLGDKIDNIPGLKGYGDVVVYELLKDKHTEQELEDKCLEEYRKFLFINELRDKGIIQNIKQKKDFLLQWPDIAQSPNKDNLGDTYKGLILDAIIKASKNTEAAKKRLNEVKQLLWMKRKR